MYTDSLDPTPSKYDGVIADAEKHPVWGQDEDELSDGAGSMDVLRIRNSGINFITTLHCTSQGFKVARLQMRFTWRSTRDFGRIPSQDH